MDSYDEYLSSRKNSTNSLYQLFSKINPMHVIGFFALFFLANRISQNSSDNNIYYALGVLVLVYLFSIMRQETERTIIPRHIALEIAKRDLEREIGEGKIFPKGTTITPIVTFKDQFFDSGEGPKIIKYNFGFKISSDGVPEKYYIYQMNPHSGDSKGIIEKNIKFSGEEVKDIQLIFPEKHAEEKKE